MQATGSMFINGRWVEGTEGELFSINPATQQQLWSGKAASKDQIGDAIQAAKQSYAHWSQLKVEQRCEYLQRYTEILTAKQQELTLLLSQETGKPTWEAKTEIAAMIGKYEISKQAYFERCKEIHKDMQGFTAVTRHKAHGIVVVLGPFNFPGHLPNGHIVPALMAGNTIVFKPSELTSYFAIAMIKCFEEAGLPQGVINLVLGYGDCGSQLVASKEIDGVFFTGSFATGHKIAQVSLDFPKRIVALEMGGNNPLIVSKPDNIDAAVYLTVQSAYTTAGQRCTCARRLIVINDDLGQQFVRKLITVVQNIKIGAYSDNPEPFMGPLISIAAADKVLNAYNKLVASGAKVLVPMNKMLPNSAFLTPAIIDVTDMPNDDEEIFGPLLRLSWVPDFATAMVQANNSNYGLSAGLISDDPKLYEYFRENIQAGVISWNRPTVGSSSSAPFGGLGKSGNHRPSAYYAADYCAYPVAAMESTSLDLPQTLNPGLKV